MGTVPGAAATMPRPMVKVSRSRTVIGRYAGTVSSSSASGRFSTCRSASSGSSRFTGSSSRSRHSSTRIMAATAVTGLVIDEMRKIVSRRIGCSESAAIAPIASIVPLAPARDERHEAGHLASLDVAGHHVVQTLEPLR